MRGGLRLLRCWGARWLARVVGLLPFLIVFGLACHAEFAGEMPSRILLGVVLLVMLRWP